MDGVSVTDYQALLNEAVTLVQAERGFVVLCEVQTGAIQSFVAVHNFETAHLTQETESLSNDDQATLRAISRLVVERQAFQGNNLEVIFSDWQGTALRRPIRNVLTVPLPQTCGLLWCDLRFWRHEIQELRMFDEAALQALMALVNERGWESQDDPPTL